MEMPPFGKGGSDIIWGLPFFGLVVFALATFGFLAALSARRNPTRGLETGYGGAIVERAQPRDSNFGTRFSSWSPAHFSQRPNEPLNQTLGLFCPYADSQ